MAAVPEAKSFNHPKGRKSKNTYAALWSEPEVNITLHNIIGSSVRSTDELTAEDKYMMDTSVAADHVVDAGG